MRSTLVAAILLAYAAMGCGVVENVPDERPTAASCVIGDSHINQCTL